MIYLSVYLPDFVDQDLTDMMLLLNFSLDLEVADECPTFDRERSFVNTEWERRFLVAQ